MPLQIIGSGFGRTGTMTTKNVLEHLGFGPCHHMIEIIENPDQLKYWKALAAGEDVNFEDVYAGYGSQVDWPGAHVFEQVATAFPDAKVIHTERPEEDWWRSFNGTIGKFFRIFRDMNLPPPLVDQFSTMEEFFVRSNFPDLTDKDAVLSAYRSHNQHVREVIPSDRLLVFSVKQGWGPLCEFLGVDAPDGPFPHYHPRDEFWSHFGGEPA